MNEFLFVFRGGDDKGAELSPEQMQEHMGKWNTWMNGLAEQGRLISGQPLKNEGKVVRDAGRLITDGPFMEGKEVVGGYLLIKAENLDKAAEMSTQCPIFDLDGFVEVREIQPME